MSANLATYERVFAHRLHTATPSALDAALALWSANYAVKSADWWYRTTLYDLKVRLLESYWRAGFVFRVTTEPDQTGDGYLWLLTVCVGGVRFEWHALPRQTDWLTACYDDPLPPWRLPVVVEATLAERLAIIRSYLRVNGGTR